MSTKSTIAHGPTFHLYHDALDERYVYLELEGVPFQASYDGVTVPIPVHIWEAIRAHPGVDLSLADETDGELQARVERYVDDRLDRYRSAETESARNLTSLLGMIPLGAADAPREDQVAQGAEYYGRRREYQRQVRAAIARLRNDSDAE